MSSDAILMQNCNSNVTYICTDVCLQRETYVMHIDTHVSTCMCIRSPPPPPPPCNEYKPRQDCNEYKHHLQAGGVP